jgi:hypothetical protein
VVLPGGEIAAEKAGGDSEYLQEQIKKALAAASDFDGDTGLEIINNLLAFDYGEKTNAVLENTAAAFKDFNFDTVTELLNRLK